MNTTLETILFTTGLVPVVKIEDPKNAPGLGEALKKGGIPIAEITFRTKSASESIRRIVGEVEGVHVGAGTVTSVELAREAKEAGAAFVVSPGFNPRVVQYCIDQQIPVIPGVNNPTAIEGAMEFGLTTLKFFPAEASGGLTMLDSLAAPYSQLKFMPTGGIGPRNLGEYARRKYITAIGGSWMVPPQAIESRDWNTITKLSKEAVIQLQGFSFGHLGINQKNEQEARTLVDFLSSLGFGLVEGNSSFFANGEIEIMKSPYLGTNGHIAIKTNNIPRALHFLKGLGLTAVPGSEKEKNEDVIAVYLQPEVGGFAWHLVLGHL